MELSKFENGITEHNNTIKYAIEHNDLYVMHEDDYSYTVGMRDVGSPELIIYGQGKAVAEEIFKIIHTAVTQEIGYLDINTIIKNIFEPALGLSEISENEKKELFYAVRTYYDDWIFSGLKITMNKCDS